MSRLANYRPPRGSNRQRRQTRPQATHDVNPPGTKRLQRYFKAKHEHYAASAEEAERWFSEYRPSTK